MLVKLKMKNFRCFVEETEVDLNATGYEILSETNKTEDNILKGALFVGGNATGKTTTILALRFLMELLVVQTDIQLMWYKSFYSKPTERMELEYEFKINESKIIYRIETLGDIIVKELLIQDGKEVLSRLYGSAEYTNMENNKIPIEKVENNQSAIRKVYFDTRFIDNDNLKAWYEFISNSVFIDPTKKIAITGNLEKANKNYFEKDGKKEVNKFLKEINYNQKIDYVSEYKNKTLKFNFQGRKEIFLIREDMDFGLPIHMESEGNRTLMNILPQVLQAIDNDCMLIIDEFSSGLHNFLEEKLIRYFMKNSKKSQMFIVSHSTNLLSNSLLRPDQIFTVDYIKGKGSKIERVSDSKPREAQNLEKMYLSGVFNGIPNFE
ncbi:MAG: ATP-binding protein [Clostridia bacterium]|nr:ATP-binding protein [Clostridia bacterium]